MTKLNHVDKLCDKAVDYMVENKISLGDSLNCIATMADIVVRQIAKSQNKDIEPAIFGTEFVNFALDFIKDSK